MRVFLDRADAGKIAKSVQLRPSPPARRQSHDIDVNATGGCAVACSEQQQQQQQPAVFEEAWRSLPLLSFRFL